MALTDPGDDQAADEFKGLISARESYYSSMGDRSVDLPEPRSSRVYALYSREIVHVPLGATAGSLVMLSALDTIGAWGVLPAAAAGLAILFTGQRAKLDLRAPGAPASLRADVAQAHDDFRDALSALGSPHTRVDVIMAVRSFEPRMDEAMRTLFDPHAAPEAASAATETVLAVGSRAWALAKVEERRTQVVEEAVASGIEPLSDATLESLPLDFTEIDSVGADVSRETLAVAAAMDVETGQVSLPQVKSDDGALLPPSRPGHALDEAGGTSGA
ncbi:hypothetical protein [Nocardioides jishulii]|uniref:Uncharacterized protein n=1 Tax=Nocardioides jishulii TaxID=2575440 RepID=A0A4U2YPB7_9ACTN|nr:hypothetical protein [Nocardioides jishulii]QCX27887.1 hypothetical protein FCL41_10420 [Nocardioides jishulii]TKI62694.1 hypothetical protein FC770_10085 [Nocardioides jishulii]